jgi:hypothetical protein
MDSNVFNRFLKRDGTPFAKVREAYAISSQQGNDIEETINIFLAYVLCKTMDTIWSFCAGLFTESELRQNLLNIRDELDDNDKLDSDDKDQFVYQVSPNRIKQVSCDNVDVVRVCEILKSVFLQWETHHPE